MSHPIQPTAPWTFVSFVTSPERGFQKKTPPHLAGLAKSALEKLKDHGGLKVYEFIAKPDNGGAEGGLARLEPINSPNPLMGEVTKLTKVSFDDLNEAQAAFEERAAISEYDGRLSREWAERLARLQGQQPSPDIERLNAAGRLADERRG